MKTFKIVAILMMVIGVTAGGLMAGDKYYKPSWGMPTGDITTFPKGHQVTTDGRATG